MKGNPRPWTQLPTPWYRRVFFDALTIVSPARAVVAWHFDQMERDASYRESVHLGMRSMGYVQKDGPSKTPWPSAGPRSADAEVLQDLHEVRERARISGRVDPVGSGLVLNFVQEMVGVGIGDRSSTGVPLKDRAINLAWSIIQKTLAPAECLEWFVVQLTIAERLIEDGEIWLRAVKASPYEPLTFELVESDRVSTPSDVLKRIEKGHSVREGVERDARDRIVAYWIAKSHPGDAAVPGTVSTKAPRLALTVSDYDRVTLDQARHVRLPGRPGQSRSLSLLKSVLQNLRDMDLVIEAVLKQTQVAASFAVFIKTASAIPDVVAATAKKYHYQLDQDLVPGMIFVLRPGEEVQSIAPGFNLPDLKVLQEVLARRIGAALGISWRVVLSDLGEANFSAARADRIEFEEAAAIPRMLLVGGLDWMRTLALEDALLMGNELLVAAGVTVEDVEKTTWLKRRKAWLDPKAEAEGASAALKGGLVTERDYFAEEGKDWQEENEQRLAEEAYKKKRRAELELGDAASLPESVVAIQAILVAVGAKQLAPESAVALIVVGFPKITKEQAEAMVGPASKLAQKAPAAAPAQPDGDAGEDDADTEEDVDGERAGSTCHRCTGQRRPELIPSG